MPKPIFPTKKTIIKTTLDTNRHSAMCQNNSQRAHWRLYFCLVCIALTLLRAWLFKKRELSFKREKSTLAYGKLAVVFMWFAQGLPAAAAPTSDIPKHSFYHHFTDVSLRDKYGNVFDAAKLQGEVALFNFIFTRCSGICPVQTKELLDVYNALPAHIRSSVNFVSVSIDPTTDTPAQLRRFAQLLGADKSNWQFLVGEADKTQQLLHALALINGPNSPIDGQINHQSHLWLVNKRGQLIMKYSGQKIDKKRLTREISQLSELP